MTYTKEITAEDITSIWQDHSVGFLKVKIKLIDDSELVFTYYPDDYQLHHMIIDREKYNKEYEKFKPVLDEWMSKYARYGCECPGLKKASYGK